LKNLERLILKLKCFFDKVLRIVRNSFAHADYEIDVENRKIIVRDKKAVIELTERDAENKLSYLTRIASISIHFYLYVIYYITKKIGISHLWNLPRNN